MLLIVKGNTVVICEIRALQGDEVKQNLPGPSWEGNLLIPVCVFSAIFVLQAIVTTLRQAPELVSTE